MTHVGNIRDENISSKKSINKTIYETLV